MKRICVSQASTAVCSGMERRPMILTADGRYAHFRDGRRRTTWTPVPCTSSQPPPVSPKLHHHHHHHHHHRRIRDESRKSSAKADSSSRKSSCVRPNDLLISSTDHHHHHVSSSRYDTPLSDMVSSQSEPISDLGLTQEAHSDYTPPINSSSSSSGSRDQVVELCVSLHCRGCEGKLRKHISKMRGVRSFTIDLATKKVTVVGDVTPLGVLASVSKVKNAKLWSP